MSLVIVASLIIIWKVAPKYGKDHLLVYITVCSLIGSLSVVAPQGLGAAIVLNITTGTPQFGNWFIYVTMVFVVCTLITEINYLNKALNLFNTAIVTPVYYVVFTSATLVASVILFQGFSASPISIMTVVMGFFVICAGVVLLQTSKTAAHSEAVKRSRSSSPELHSNDDYPVSELEGEKADLDPGPISLRAVPFDAIRQIVRASTMPNSPYTAPDTPAHNNGAVYDQNREGSNHNARTRRGFFSRFRQRSDHGNNNGTPWTPLQTVMVVNNDEDEDSKVHSLPVEELKPMAMMPKGEKTEYNEDDDEIPVVQRTVPPTSGDDRTESSLASEALTLRE
jgi:hypothetical protein